ncbi:MAG: hypothetical protein U0414_10410 [Polyangiaceae bacterium]
MRASVLVALSMISAALGCGPPPAAPVPLASAGPPVDAPAEVRELPAAAADGAPERVPQLVRGRDAFSVYSEDGTLAFTALYGAFALVEVDTGRVRGTVPVGCVAGASFTGDGRFVVFGECSDAGDGVFVWDLARNEVRATSLHLPKARVIPQPGGHLMLVRTEGAALVLDAWTLESRSLELPRASDLWLTRVAPDGTVTLFGKTALFRFEPGSSKAKRTDLAAKTAFIAGDAELEHGLAVVLQADGTATVVDPTRKEVVIERPACNGEPAYNVRFRGDGKHLFFHCGRAIVELDEGLEILREVVREDTRTLQMDVAKDGLFVQRGDELARFDPDREGPTGATIRVSHPVLLAGGARVAERGGSFVADAKTGAVIWAPGGGLPGLVRDLRPAAALFTDRAAVDLHTGAAFFADALSADGRVSVSTETKHAPSADQGVATITNRPRAEAWTASVDPKARVTLSSSGRYAIELGSDSAQAAAAPVVIHDPKASRRIESPLGVVVGPEDRLVTGGADGLCHVHALDTATETTVPVDVRGGMPVFAGKDRLVFRDRGEVWDVEKRAVAWTVPPGDRILAAAANAEIVAVGAPPSADVTDPPLRLVLATDGSVVSQIPKGGTVLALSLRRALLERKDGVILRDGDAETPVHLGARAARTPVALSEDGRIVWYQRLDDLVAAHRVADGRELLFSPGVAPVTDEGVFDAADVDRVPYLVRTGPNLLTSRLEPASTRLATHGHRDLLADFFGGAPIGPAPTP